MRDRRITLLAIWKWGLALVLLSWCAVAWINAFDVIHTRDWIRVPATIDTLTAINHQGERLTPFGEWDGRGTLEVKYYYEVAGTIQAGTRVGVESPPLRFLAPAGFGNAVGADPRQRPRSTSSASFP
jgi:hypothetical protein